MTKKEKKLVMDAIVKALTDRGIKDYMTGGNNIYMESFSQEK